jgi:hypothetical protein
MKTEQLAPWEDPLCEDPIHMWFSLSYASYVVIPRTVLQSCSRETQLAVVRAFELVQKEEQTNRGQNWPGDADVSVNLRDENGRFIKDPLADYKRGSRKLW